MTKRKWAAVVAGITVALVVGAGAVMAQSQDDGSSTPTFLDRLAQKLGIDRPKLDQAIKDARGDEIDEKVADGDLTQEQADKLKQRLDEQPADGPFFGKGPGHPGGGGFRFEFGDKSFELDGKAFGFGIGGFLPGIGDARDKLAEFLSITPDQLNDELTAEDATIASVAEAHGKSRDDLKTFIHDEAKTKLDELVANQDLTQKQEDEILSRLDEHADDLIDAPIGRMLHPFKGGFPFRDRTPDDETAPQSGGAPGAPRL
ncbi:MAG TPA: hypothetical protein VIH21_03155 [Dehalococcoidia bacterium]